MEVNKEESERKAIIFEYLFLKGYFLKDGHINITDFIEIAGKKFVYVMGTSREGSLHMKYINPDTIESISIIEE